MSSPIRPGTAHDAVALSVHGPAGVLDLQVPAGASGTDVAAEYSRQASLPTVPQLYTLTGQLLQGEVSLVEAGVGSGAVLVASGEPAAASASSASSGSRRIVEAAGPGLRPGPLSGLWFAIAVVVAVGAGGYAATLVDSTARDATVATLVAAAVLGSLPWGPWAEHRVLAAPAFAGAAAFAVAWEPDPVRLPTVIGIAALSAAMCATVARAIDRHAEEGLRVWALVGVGVFTLATGAALVGAEAQVVWSVLLLAAMLAARFVPQMAVDVPDHYLLDLERLAVTAWSARERPVGRRGRVVVPRQLVEGVSQHGARLVTASSVAVLVVAATSSALLLGVASSAVDVVGARCQVGFCGGALLLAARSYRHVGARAALRAAGLSCWGVLAVALLASAGEGAALAIVVAAVVLGALVIVVAVALGRGWRSAWWSRRAEVAESFCAALGVGSVVAAAGLMSALWN